MLFRIITIVLILFVSIYAFKQNEYNLYRLDKANRSDISSIQKAGGDIGRFYSDKFVEVYLNQDQYNELVRKGLLLYQIIDQDKVYADSLFEITKNSKNPMLGYHTYQEITDTLAIWAQQFSSIAELHSIGQTVQGREMWVMKISDNVRIEEAEPEFKYISTMHGDEVVGKEMMIELIRMLLHEYGNTQRITDLVDSTEIWIMPNMNFDGTEGNTIYPQRYNANGVNLNRNFPDREYGAPPYIGHNYIVQPETQNVIDFTARHHFVLSANFHGGALVANYPWDKKLPGDPGSGNYSACPDDITFIDLALTYAQNNLPMYNSTMFTNGITNGADWYEIDGGMQDWNYFDFNCMEITMEISETKWPSVTTLPQFWQDNKESLLSYMEKVHTGIRGIVTDQTTGLPLDVSVTVMETGSNVNTDPDFGDYYKIISPGTYDILFTASGYLDSLITNVNVDSFPTSVLNVQLIPDPTFTLEILAEDILTKNPIENVKISIYKNNNLFITDSTDIDGMVSLQVEPDSFRIKLSANGYFEVDSSIKVISDTSIIYQMSQYIPAILKGTVSSSTGGSVSGAAVYCDGKIDSIGSDGLFRLEGIKPGNVIVLCSLQGHITSRLDTAVNNGDSVNLSIMMEPGDNEIFDDFESSSRISYFSNGDWQHGIPSTGPMSAFSGVNLWATNLDADYNNGGILSTLETGEIVIFGISNPVLKFYHWYSTENGVDGGNVKISADNGATWQVLNPNSGYPVSSLPAGGGNPLATQPAFSGLQQYWNEVTFNLLNYTSYPVIKLRFDFGADHSGSDAGWYIDDLQIFNNIVVKRDEQYMSHSPTKPTLNNYPNPFNPVTNISIFLPKSGEVNLQVFDITGALVKTIVSQKFQAGQYTFKWDSTNKSNIKVASGVYILKLSSNSFVINKKILLMR